MTHLLTKDRVDLLFRLLFSSIFLGMGGEHLFSNALIRQMMPVWLASVPLVTEAAGIVLLVGGLHVLLGYRIHRGAAMLGGFLLVVTLGLHGPALFSHPAGLPSDWHWLWDVYQRSNFVKNLCLLGVCLQLLHHVPGRYSLDHWLAARRTPASRAETAARGDLTGSGRRR
ncbi:MAG: hypothetical protein H7338_19100 [Candidatus Sericytochromatia bacterium]|nr:hypothetical protein [Candidatus Sericytochromatia bacterium]